MTEKELRQEIDRIKHELFDDSGNDDATSGTCYSFEDMAEEINKFDRERQEMRAELYSLQSEIDLLLQDQKKSNDSSRRLKADMKAR